MIFKVVSRISSINQYHPIIVCFFAGLVHYAKLQYDCGNYTLSGELLKHYRSMISQENGVGVKGGTEARSASWDICMYKFYMYINYIVIFNFLLYPFYGDLHSLSLECS